MANAPKPRGGKRQQITVRARRVIALANVASRAVLALVLLSAGFSSIAQAEEGGQWRPRKTSSDSSTWSPDAAGRLLGDTSATSSTRWLPSKPQTPLAKPADQKHGKPADHARPSGPPLPRYAALRAEIDAIHADFSKAVDSNADPGQFDLILVRAYRVQDDAQTPSERALADELFERIAKHDGRASRKSRADQSPATRNWLGDLSAEASGLGTLIFTGHDEARSRPQNIAVQHASSTQPRTENSIASNPVRGALTRLMSYSSMDRNGNVWLESPFDSPRVFQANHREPARFTPAGTIQPVAATEPLNAQPVISAPRATTALQFAPTPSIASQVPLLAQLGAGVGASVPVAPGIGVGAGTTVFPPPPATASEPYYPPTRAFVNLDFLGFWLKGDQLPPLVTTSPLSTPLNEAAVLGFPTTTLLFGDRRVNEGFRPGGRVQGGLWFLDDEELGVDGHYYALATETTDFAAASQGLIPQGSYLGIPFVNGLNDAENAYLLAAPTTTGAVAISESSNVQSAGGGLRALLAGDASGGNRFYGITGYRFFRLDEVFTMATSTFQPIPNFFTATFDRFATKNIFNGGYLGGILELQRGPFWFWLTPQCAIGNMNQQVNISGATASILSQSNQGIFARSTNIGDHSRNVFAVIPEIEGKIGLQIRPWFIATVGYNFTWVSSVVRPGNEIDRTINPVYPAFGPPRPEVKFAATSLWLQGVTAGFQVIF